MTLSIKLPEQAEQALRSAFGEDLGRAAIETLAIEGYRMGRLSTYQVQTLLGLEDRWQTETWLARHHANVNYGWEDFEADRAGLERVLGSAK